MTHISLKARPCSPCPMPLYPCSFPSQRCLPTQPGGKPRCWRKAQVLAESPGAGGKPRCWRKAQVLAESPGAGGKPRCWRKAQVLAESPGAAGGRDPDPGPAHRRAALRVMGRSGQQDYARYHEVLNRAVWSPGEAAHILLLLLQHLDHSDGPLICGIRAFYQSRNPGTASRSSDQRSGQLPGRGAFQPQLRGQGQRSARDFSAVAGPGTLGRTPFP